ncbi:ComF family protein [Thermomonas sp. RSS23]|uniref:ComF family protein n=1 Tax=Thermomonas beijingensis TaxID=2872701 RepID=A0ABS7TGP3_9GAMM|nr:ComF family protein [Thermomonas beijingensis]MBZ4187040.1 ComF family protein [Thermomonas beijingensis]
MDATVNQITISKVDRHLHAPLGWLLPPRCVVCGDAGMPGRDVCACCHADLPWQGLACGCCALPLPTTGICGHCLQQPSPLDAAHAAFDYSFPLDRLLPRLKFHADFACGRMLAQCMAERFAALPRPAAIVPVPLHPARLRRRGYDQALELAKPIARALALPLRGNLLQRGKPTSAQSRLHADARQRNLRDAFRVATLPDLPAHIALLDDVMTTGATLYAAAQALRNAGVARVDAWVCARVA